VSDEDMQEAWKACQGKQFTWFNQQFPPEKRLVGREILRYEMTRLFCQEWKAEMHERYGDD